MWAGFEWENKVTVHTNIDNLRDYLHHLVTVSYHCFPPVCENYHSANKYEMFDTRKNAYRRLRVLSGEFIRKVNVWGICSS